MTDIGFGQEPRIVKLHATAAAPARRPGVWRALGRLAVTAVDMLLTWQERATARRHLSGLDDRLLSDMGLDRGDVSREVDKPFWRG